MENYFTHRSEEVKQRVIEDSWKKRAEELRSEEFKGVQETIKEKGKSSVKNRREQIALQETLLGLRIFISFNTYKATINQNWI